MIDLKNKYNFKNFIQLMSEQFTDQEFNEIFEFFNHHKQKNNKDEVKNIFNIIKPYVTDNYNDYSDNTKALIAYVFFLALEEHDIELFDENKCHSIVDQFINYYNNNYQDYTNKISKSNFNDGDKDVVDLIFARAFTFNALNI